MSTAQAWLSALAVGLVFMAGLLAGTETALARVSRVTVEEVVREGRRGPRGSPRSSPTRPATSTWSSSCGSAASSSPP